MGRLAVSSGNVVLPAGALADELVELAEVVVEGGALQRRQRLLAGCFKGLACLVAGLFEARLVR
jgi:hypothetical protein